MLPVKFENGSNSTIQMFSSATKLITIYLSKAGCIEINIIPSCFLHPMPSQPEIINAVNTTPAAKSSFKTVTKPTIPPKPPKRLQPATDHNVPKFEQYLRDAFKDTTFDISPPFPAMTGLPAHIPLKPDAIPYGQHKPIPVPYNHVPSN